MLLATTSYLVRAADVAVGELVLVRARGAEHRREGDGLTPFFGLEVLVTGGSDRAIRLLALPQERRHSCREGDGARYPLHDFEERVRLAG